MNRKRLLIHMLLGVVILALVAACSTSSPANQAPSQEASQLPSQDLGSENKQEIPQESPSVTEDLAAPEAPGITPEATAVAVLPQETPVSATVPPTQEVVTVRTDLHASDPETVVLASGGIQLVEFFAYW